MAATRAGTLVLPRASAGEAALWPQASLAQADSLQAVCAMLNGQARLEACPSRCRRWRWTTPTWSDLKGQLAARGALEIAAAGRHSLLLSVCRRAPVNPCWPLPARHLPAMSETGAGSGQRALAGQRRAGPDTILTALSCAGHHSASAAALVGGGGQPRPGEGRWPLHGVLFWMNCLSSSANAGHAARAVGTGR